MQEEPDPQVGAHLAEDRRYELKLVVLHPDGRTLVGDLEARSAGGLAGGTGGRYFGYVTGGSLPAAAIVEAWTAAVDQNPGMWPLGPAGVEEIWPAIADVVGLGPEDRGVDGVLAFVAPRKALVILDNLGSHKGKPARNLIRSTGAHLLFLPPYSPDLNPIEQVFAKLKHLTRAAEPRDLEVTWRKVGQLLDLFSAKECANYLKNSGYVSM